MNLTEIYTLLFTDTLVSNFAFNASSEIAISSMKIFGLHDPYIIVVVAALAFFASCCINYVLGVICYRILSPLNSEENNKNIKIDLVRNNKHLPLLLLLSAVPFFGKFIILFSGFCKVRPLLAISIGSLAKLVYYAIFMLVL